MSAPTDGVGPIPTIRPTPPEYQHATAAGHRTLWVVFALMLLSTGAFTGLAWRVPIGKRLFHVVTTLITLIATLSYYAMATGQGQTAFCSRQWDHHDTVPDTSHIVCRQVYWARYVDWALTTPLLLLDLSLLAGLDGARTIIAIVADLVMILGGLFAALGSHSSLRHHTGGGGDRAHDQRDAAGHKWGWYTIACLAFLTIIWHVGLHGTRAAKARGGSVARVFGGLAPYTLILWTAYPIVWAIADGSRLLDVNAEIAVYAVLDVLAKGVFGAWLLVAHRRVPETNVDIGGYWTHGLSGESGILGRIRIGDDEEN